MKINEVLSEAQVRDSKYVPVINQLLQRKGINLPLQPQTVEYGTDVVDFFPLPNQQIKSLSDTIQGKLNGKVVTVAANKLFKSDILKNLITGRPEEKVNINRGELAEGYHAAAVFARLIKRPLTDITLKDIQVIINRLNNGKQLTLTKREVESEVADRFEIMIALKPQSWEAFKDPESVVKMGGMMDSIITDANHETSRFAERFATNSKFDTARVIGDGISEESERKADVQFINTAEQKFAGFSLKTSTTKQVDQVGGGAMKDSKKGKKATPEQRYNILANDLFAVRGQFPLADISAVKSQILSAGSVLDMQKIAYREATNSFNRHLQTNNQEKGFIQNLSNALRFWMAKDDPNIKLKQFTDKGTFILDPSRVSYLIDNDNLDLAARYAEGSSGLPSITIYDKNSNKSLVTIRTKEESNGYWRNLIEKETIWVLLTKIRHIPNTANNTTPGQQPAIVKKPTKMPVKPAPPTPGIANQNAKLAVSKQQMGQDPEVNQV
jgi:hypothetical protein